MHVECETLDQVRESLEAGADALLLDNMTPAQVTACIVEVRDHASRHGVRPLVEASGGITLAVVADSAATGVACISSQKTRRQVKLCGRLFWTKMPHFSSRSLFIIPNSGTFIRNSTFWNYTSSFCND